MALLSRTVKHDLSDDAAAVLDRIIERGDFLVVGDRTFLLSALSPATIDALAAFSARDEDREEEPVEDDGD